jgi:hypothetical protein
MAEIQPRTTPREAADERRRRCFDNNPKAFLKALHATLGRS